MPTPEATLSSLATQLREQITAYVKSSKVPGYLAGAYHAGQQSVIAHGLANVVTGAPMRDDTGFLFGSVTQVLTKTLVLQQVERGAIDLDERVVTYLPEFTLTTPGAAARIRVRHLLSHTNGIDADLFFPDAGGRGALKAYLDQVRQHCGTLFGPDEYISYSNGGMVVAGRLLEVVTGTAYHDLLKRELYAPVGMDYACTYVSRLGSNLMAFLLSALCSICVAKTFPNLRLCGRSAHETRARTTRWRALIT